MFTQVWSLLQSYRFLIKILRNFQNLSSSFPTGIWYTGFCATALKMYSLPFSSCASILIEKLSWWLERTVFSQPDCEYSKNNNSCCDPVWSGEVRLVRGEISEGLPLAVQCKTCSANAPPSPRPELGIRDSLLETPDGLAPYLAPGHMSWVPC